MIKYWPLDDLQTIEMVMTWKAWTLVQKFKNIQNECKDNKMVVQSNDLFTTESVEVTLEMLFLMT